MLPEIEKFRFFDHRTIFSILIICACCFPLITSTTELPADEKEDNTFFERRIRPVLITECYSCHSSAAAEIKGGLRVDSRDAIREGGETGPAVVPGKVDKSLLIEAIRHQSFEMPPDKKLSNTVIADFEKWIKMGAPDPRDNPPSASQASQRNWDLILEQRKNWWSLQPVAVVSPPEVETNDWSDKPIDRFIFAQLSKHNLAPAADADALTLLRRLSFILTGLPPSPEDVESFPQKYQSNHERALSELVDKLLDSTHYGERMARHWMDVVRYTDTYGYEWDNPARGSWEYRDYLIRALNQDTGFDQLIREQIAGDLLPNPRIDSKSGLNESLIGPMFYHLGEHRHGDNVLINGVREEMIDNKIDAFSKAFLAMTIACARCHDHKLDAASQRDYYALASIFMTPRWISRSIESPNQNRQTINNLKVLRADISSKLKDLWSKQAASFKNELIAAFTEEQKSENSELSRSHFWRVALGLEKSKEDSNLDKPGKNFTASAGLDGLSLLASRICASQSVKTVAEIWNEQRKEWKSVREKRASENNKKFKVLTNFDEPGLPTGWITEGDGMRYGYVADGTPLIALKGDSILQSLLPKGYHTHALSSKLPGALRIPPQENVPGKYVSLEIAGGEWSGSIQMIDNAFQTETVKFLDQPNPEWVALKDIELTNDIQRSSFDLVTSDLNPNFPPRTGIAKTNKRKLPESDMGFKKRSWFSVTEIVTHDQAGTPADDLVRYAALFQKPPPETVHQAAERIASWLTSAVTNWVHNQADSNDVILLNWLIQNNLLTNKSTDHPELKSLVDQFRKIETKIPFPRTANSMDERETTPFNYLLNIRGSIHNRGKPVPHRLLQVFSDHDKIRDSHGSGRRELAEFLVDEKHAFSARVYVNRVWQWVFGKGLVRTSNDFGRLGDAPSHPKLLDFLARQFIADGWSTKQLMRQLVLTRTFRQSGQTSNRAIEIDPENRFLHHFSTRRLEAEAIRDTLLAVSGKLDPQLFGKPINPHRHVEDPAKRLFSGPVDGNGRRSIYLQVSIMDPPKFLLSFNFPDPKLPTGQRDVTNVPAQALVLLNNPFVLSLADHWSDNLIHDGSATPTDRLLSMFLRALGRPPNKNELTLWSELVDRFSEGNNKSLLTDRLVWKNVAHTLFNTKEFINFR